MVVVAGLLTACGSVGKVPPSDGTGPGDGPTGPVMVTVLSTTGDGVPDPTAKVVFQDPGGNVVADTGVDAMGHAQAMVQAGGSVSVVRVAMDTPANLTASITTTLGVQPGDNLTFGLKANAVILNQGGSTMMTATSFTPATGATNYRFYTPCGVSGMGTAAPFALSLRDSCHGSMFDLLGVTSGISPPMFLLLTGITYVPGGSFTIPTLFNPMVNFTINITNVPDPVTQISASRTTLLNNTLTFSASNSVQGDPPAGNVSVVVPFPPGVGTRSEVSILMGRGDAMINQQHDVHTATLDTSATVDLSKLQLPWFTNLTPTPTGATWSMVAPGDPPDGMLVTWSGSWNDGARPVQVSWSVAAPASMTGLTLPRLPAAYAKYDPEQQSVAVKPASATLYMADYDNVTGYDQLRQMPETLLTQPIGVMGAFVAMPFQRRYIKPTVALP